ncbi:MAG: IS110 family transposase [Planctomycetota bacterium]
MRTGRKRSKREYQELEQFKKINLDAAGIDVGASESWVAVPEGRDPNPVRCFPSFTADLRKMAEWLKQCGIQTVAMESTGVYWIPIFQVLESQGIEVKLVNARHVKHVPGRKSDIQDCQWLQQLHMYGLLSGSFRPDESICVLRNYLRQRDGLVQDASREVLHMHKALTQMNVQIHNVISDVTGKTGMAILRAILQGERDPLKLARLKDPRIKSSEEEIAKSLEGDYRAEHLFSLRQALERYDFYHRQMEECDREIEAYLNQFPPRDDKPIGPLPERKGSRKNRKRGNAPKFEIRPLLHQITGVDLTRIEGINEYSGLMILSEIGTDVSKFPTEKHFTSYLGLSPDHRISGGKVLRRSTRSVVNRVAKILRVAALTLKNSSSYLGAYYRRMRNRIGAPKAITATARKMACIIYRMLKYGEEYVARNQEYYEQKNQERMINYLKKQASKFGLNLTPQSAPKGSVS